MTEVEGTIYGKKVSTSLVLAPIEFGLAQLRFYQKNKTSAYPEELAWEIRLYEWILAQPDAEEKARQYGAARSFLGSGAPVPKREVVKRLGWEIP